MKKIFRKTISFVTVFEKTTQVRAQASRNNTLLRLCTTRRKRGNDSNERVLYKIWEDMKII